MWSSGVRTKRDQKKDLKPKPTAMTITNLARLGQPNRGEQVVEGNAAMTMVKVADLRRGVIEPTEEDQQRALSQCMGGCSWWRVGAISSEMKWLLPSSEPVHILVDVRSSVF